MLWWHAMKAGSTAMTQRPRDSSQWKHASSPRPKKARQSKSTHKFFLITFFWQHWHDLHALGSHWTDSQQGILCWGFKGVREDIRRKRPALFKSGEWHFHLDHAPVHNSILVTDYLTKIGIKTVCHPPYWPGLAPCDFCLFPKLKEKLRGSRYETIEEMKRLWRRSLTRSHKRTSMGPFRSSWNGKTSALQPEEITSKGTRVSCVYYQ